MTPNDKITRLDELRIARAQLDAKRERAAAAMAERLAAYLETKATCSALRLEERALIEEAKGLEGSLTVPWEAYVFTRDDYEANRIAVVERLRIARGSEWKIIAADLEALRERGRALTPGALPNPRPSPYCPIVRDTAYETGRLALLPERARRVLAYRIAATLGRR